MLVHLDYFLKWATSKKLNKDTVKKLVNEDWDDFDALRVAAKSQLESLKISEGQRALLFSAVDELKSFDSTGRNPRVAYFCYLSKFYIIYLQDKVL